MTHESFAESLELNDVGCQDRSDVSVHEALVLPYEQKRVRVEHEVHLLFLRDVDRESGEGLHVGFAAEAGPDDEDVKTFEEGGEFWAEVGGGSVERWGDVRVRKCM